MSEAAARRLRQFGILALAFGFLTLFMLAFTRGEYEKLDASTLILALITAGIGLLVFSEIGPSLTSIKAGDIEATFVSTAGDKFLKLEERSPSLNCWPPALLRSRSNRFPL